MDSYNFWQDFFDTYQSLSDWIKLAWLVVPPAFLLGMVALVLRHRLASRRQHAATDAELVYSIHRVEDGGFRVFRHGPVQPQEPTLVLPVSEQTDNITQLLERSSGDGHPSSTASP